MSTRAVIYLRLSSDKRGDEAGVQRQREDCLKLADARGLDVIEVCTDNDVSALTKNARPGFERVMTLLGDGTANAVVAWNFERVLKTRADQLRFIGVGQERGVLLALARGSDIDMGTPGGRLLADILSSIARNETEVKSDRQRRANKQRAEKGLPHISQRPFGYEADCATVRESEAKLIRLMVDKFLSGWSIRDLTRWLNAEGYQSTKGNEWNKKVVRNHLLSKRNAALRVYEGVEYTGNWEPIISVETHQRVLAEFDRRARRTTATPISRKYLLTGLLYCGTCEQTMAGARKRDKPGGEVREKYVCPNYPHGSWCGNNTRLAAPLEYLVKESVIFRLDTPTLRELLSQPGTHEENGELLMRHQEHVNRLNTLVDDYADGTLTKAEYSRAKSRVSDALGHVELELMSLYSSQSAKTLLSAGESVRDAWDKNTEGWRRQLLELVIEKVIVHRTNTWQQFPVDGQVYRFDANSVEIVWKA